MRNNKADYFVRVGVACTIAYRAVHIATHYFKLVAEVITAYPTTAVISGIV